MATLKEGTIKNCNTDGKSWGGTIVNYPGSTAGALHAENLTVENSYVNFIDVDLQHVTVSNVTVTNPSAQTGVAIDSMFEPALMFTSTTLTLTATPTPASTPWAALP